MERRKIMVLATLLFGSISVIAVAQIFIGSLRPTEATRRARVLTVDISEIPKNSYKLFNWNGRSIAVFRTGNDSSEYLIKINKATNGPYYTNDNMPIFFAYELIGTFKGCILNDTQEYGYKITDYTGWFDPCHLGVWDYSGRYIPGENTPENITLPNLTALKNYTQVSSFTIEFTP